MDAQVPLGISVVVVSLLFHPSCWRGERRVRPLCAALQLQLHCTLFHLSFQLVPIPEPQTNFRHKKATIETAITAFTYSRLFFIN